MEVKIRHFSRRVSDGLTRDEKEGTGEDSFRDCHRGFGRDFVIRYLGNGRRWLNGVLMGFVGAYGSENTGGKGKLGEAT